MYPAHETIRPSEDPKRFELLEILAEADDDVRNGRVAPIKDTFVDLRNRLKNDYAHSIFSN